MFVFDYWDGSYNTFLRVSDSCLKALKRMTPETPRSVAVSVINSSS